MSIKATIQAKVMADVAMHFRPELLNRIDESVVFNALAQSHIAIIAELQLESVRARLADRFLTLSVKDGVMTHLSYQGFDPAYGARPLKRTVQRLIENPLAEALLYGEFEPGDTIEISMTGSELRFVNASAIIVAA